MPIIIAGLVYLAALVPVLVVCLVRGAVPRRELVVGWIGSATGFVVGCVGAVAALLLASGADVSATLVVTVLALTGATVGTLLGVALQRRLRSRAWR